MCSLLVTTWNLSRIHWRVRNQCQWLVGRQQRLPAAITVIMISRLLFHRNIRINGDRNVRWLTNVLNTSWPEMLFLLRSSWERTHIFISCEMISPCGEHWYQNGIQKERQRAPQSFQSPLGLSAHFCRVPRSSIKAIFISYPFVLAPLDCSGIFRLLPLWRRIKLRRTLSLWGYLVRQLLFYSLDIFTINFLNSQNALIILKPDGNLMLIMRLSTNSG